MRLSGWDSLIIFHADECKKFKKNISARYDISREFSNIATGHYFHVD